MAFLLSYNKMFNPDSLPSIRISITSLFSPLCIA
jgi:hypothetical protein